MRIPIFLLAGFILGIFLSFILRKIFSPRTQNTPPEAQQNLDITPIDVTIEGIFFRGIPTALFETLQQLEKEESVRYARIIKMQSLSDQSKENIEILLALSWMQAAIVESGAFIDDIENDYQIGRSFLDKYENDAGDHYSNSYLPVADKLDLLHGKIDWWKANPL